MHLPSLVHLDAWPIKPMAPCADVPADPFQLHLLNEEDGNVHANMQARLRRVPGVPYADLRSRQWEGAIQARAYRNIWDPVGAELVFYWPAYLGTVPVNDSAINPGLSLTLNGTDAANYTVRFILLSVFCFHSVKCGSLCC
jgi:hypothetical protein